MATAIFCVLTKDLRDRGPVAACARFTRVECDDVAGAEAEANPGGMCAGGASTGRNRKFPEVRVGGKSLQAPVGTW